MCGCYQADLTGGEERMAHQAYLVCLVVIPVFLSSAKREDVVERVCAPRYMT